MAYVLGILIFTASAVIAGHSAPRQPDTGQHGIGYGLTLSWPGGRSFTLQNRALTIGQSSQSSASGNNTGAQNNSLALTHSNIITTEFWVGEPADADNGYIANSASAWDEQWKAHYGGFDDPNNRNGYLPAAFTPQENPFYFALPYSDFTDSGVRKASAIACLNSNDSTLAAYSWCKNTWIAISHGGKTVYAQWEDVGPFEEDDTAYVFGSATPKNQQGAKAGLDVSPAVNNYLNLQDVDTCTWSFVTANDVPSGPWSQIVTTDKGFTVSN
jgi:hypothetical protein